MKEKTNLGVFEPKDDVAKGLYEQSVTNIENELKQYANTKIVEVLARLKIAVTTWCDNRTSLKELKVIDDFIELIDKEIDKHLLEK